MFLPSEPKILPSLRMKATILVMRKEKKEVRAVEDVMEEREKEEMKEKATLERWKEKIMDKAVVVLKCCEITPNWS